jgi:hypothetical protein
MDMEAVEPHNHHANRHYRGDQYEGYFCSDMKRRRLAFVPK